MRCFSLSSRSCGEYWHRALVKRPYRKLFAWHRISVHAVSVQNLCSRTQKTRFKHNSDLLNKSIHRPCASFISNPLLFCGPYRRWNLSFAFTIKNIQPIRIIYRHVWDFNRYTCWTERHWTIPDSFEPHSPKSLRYIASILPSVSRWNLMDFFFQSSEVIIRSFVKVRGSWSNPDLFNNITKQSS